MLILFIIIIAVAVCTVGEAAAAALYMSISPILLDLFDWVKFMTNFVKTKRKT